MTNLHLNQGKNCKYILKHTGLFNDSIGEFKTEQALDNHIESLLNSNFEINGESAMFSVDHQSHAIKILDQITEDVKARSEEVVRDFNRDEAMFHSDGEEIEFKSYTRIPRSIGTTRFITTFGNLSNLYEGLITPFNLQSWEEHFREDRKGVYSEEEITKMIREQEDVLWPKLTQYGTDVHEVIDATFQEVLNNKEPYKRTSKTLITDGQIEQVKSYTRNLIQDLKEKHGNSAKFYTEFSFISKEIAPEIKAVLEASGYDSINGKADLIVLDEFGQVHIYDFKVSRKDVGDFNQTNNILIGKKDFEHGLEGEWATTKKETARYQLAMYANILRQHGLKVASTSLIPIKIDFYYNSEYDIKEIKALNIPLVSELEKDSSKSQVINVSGTLGLGKQANNVNNRILPVEHKISGEKLQSTVDIFNQLIPGFNIGLKARRTERNIEQLRKKVRKSTNPNYKWVFKRDGVDGTWVNCETDEKLETELNRYLDDINARRANELLDISNLINIELNGNKNYQKILDNFSEEKQSIVEEQIKKYFVEPGWTFNQDDTLNSFGIFEFERGGKVEIIIVTNNELFNTYNLGFGDTLLGGTTRNKDAVSRNILSASNANIELMKVMVYLSENQDKYAGKKITQIKVYNPWFAEVSDNVMNSTLIENYEALRLRNPKAKAKQLSTSIFQTDYDSIVDLIMSRSEMMEKKVIDFDEKYDAGQVQDLEIWCTKAIADLKRKYTDLYGDNPERSEAWNAYTLLNQMLLQINRITMVNETITDPWVSGLNLSTNVTSAQFSNSKNIQEFARLHDRYVAEVRTKVEKLGFEMRKAFKKLADEEGTGADVFRYWFKTNPDGSIADEFEVLDPDDPNFKGSELSRQTLRLYLETMHKIKHPSETSEYDILARKNSGEYYRVPLMEAVFSRQAKNLGFVAATKNKIREYAELTADVFAGESETKRIYETNNNKLYNKFDLDLRQRKDKIDKYSIGFFETHMELIFNNALVAYTKQQISEKYVPLFKAMQIQLKRIDEGGQENLKVVRETLDKLIDNRFYGKNIMSEGLQPYYRWLAVISRMFSTMKLGLNVRSFIRETFTGMYIGATRTMVKQQGDVSLENYNKAIGYILQDLPNNPSGVSMIQQLNALYGMANYSLSNIVNQRKTNWLSVKNWSQDTLFIGCSAPDYQHRMAILIARMMDDGCWEAFSLDENDQLVYDFAKDSRFSVYLSGDTSNPKYKEQKTLYLKNIEEWNAQGYHKEDGSYLQEGDALPQPYTNREAQSIKNYADILYGHYDDESRSLMNDMFLGSFFMQFKTFVTAKLEQWTMKGGIYNVEYLKQQYDPVTGEKLYEIMRYPNADNTGMPYREIIKESELNALSEYDKELARPYIEWTGQPMEGMMRGAWRMATALKSLNPEEIKRVWNDPHDRGLLLLGFSDLILMSALMLIIKALYGAAVGSDEWKDINRDVRESNYFTSMSYNILRGITNDNSIFSVVGSMATDLNPPLITNLTQFVNSSWSVICGNQSLAYALTSNVGMLSDFKGMVKEWEEVQKSMEN